MKLKRSYFRIPNRPDFLSPSFKLTLTEDSKKVFEDIRPGGGMVFYVNLKNGDIHFLPAFNHNDGLFRVDKNGIPYEENQYTSSKHRLGVLAGDLHYNGEDKLQIGHLGGPNGNLLGGGLFKSGYAIKFLTELPMKTALVGDEILVIGKDHDWNVYKHNKRGYLSLITSQLSNATMQKLHSIDSVEALMPAGRKEVEDMILDDLFILPLRTDEVGIKSLRNRSTYENSRACFYDEDFLSRIAMLDLGQKNGAHLNSIKRELPLDVFQKTSNAICDGLGIPQINVLSSSAVDGMIFMHLGPQNDYRKEFVISIDEQNELNGTFAQLLLNEYISREEIRAISSREIYDLLLFAISLEEINVIPTLLKHESTVTDADWLLMIEEKYSNLDIIELLINTNAVNVNAKNSKGHSALDIAIQNNFEIAELILKSHQRIDEEVIDSAVSRALNSSDTHLITIELLLKYKENNHDITNNNNESIFAKVVRAVENHAEIVKVLKQFRTLNLNIFEMVVTHLETIKELTQQGIPVAIINQLCTDNSTKSSLELNQLQTQAENLIQLNRSDLLKSIGNSALEISKHPDVCNRLCYLKEQDALSGDIHRTLYNLIKEDKLTVWDLEQAIENDKLQKENEIIQNIEESVGKKRGNIILLMTIELALREFTLKPFLYTRGEFINNPLLKQFAETKSEFKDTHDHFVLWFRLEEYLRDKPYTSSKTLQVRLKKIEEALQQCIQEKPISKARGTSMSSHWIDGNFIAKVYSLNDENISNLFLKYLPAPRPEVFAGRAIPEIIKNKADSSIAAMNNVLSKVDNKPAFEKQVVGVQRMFRANKRRKEEMARVSSQNNLTAEAAKKLLEEANTPYTPQCETNLANRIMKAASNVKLFTNVKHSLSNTELKSNFDDGLYGKRSLLQFYLPIKTNLGFKNEYKKGDANVVCMGVNEMHPFHKSNIELEFDAKKIAENNPCAFFKQRNLGFNLEKDREIYIGDFHSYFSHTSPSDMPKVPGLIRDESSTTTPFKLYDQTGTGYAFADINNNLIVSYNIEKMHQILTLNFFRFIDALYDRDLNPANATKEKIYSELAKLDDHALISKLQEIGTLMTDTMEFNFYGAYKIDFSALLTVKSSSSYSLTLSTFIKALNKGETNQLHEARKMLPDIFNSYRFLDYLSSQVTNATVTAELNELRSKCNSPSWMNPKL